MNAIFLKTRRLNQVKHRDSLEGWMEIFKPLGDVYRMNIPKN